MKAIIRIGDELFDFLPITFSSLDYKLIDVCNLLAAITDENLSYVKISVTKDLPRRIVLTTALHTAYIAEYSKKLFSTIIQALEISNRKPLLEKATFPSLFIPNQDEIFDFLITSHGRRPILLIPTYKVGSYNHYSENGVRIECSDYWCELCHYLRSVSSKVVLDVVSSNGIRRDRSTYTTNSIKPKFYRGYFRAMLSKTW